MKVQQVLLRAMSGEISWLQAADVLGMSPRTVRRWRSRLERDGYDGLLDRRRRLPSPRRAPVEQVQAVLRLYRLRFQGFNVRHFHELATERHGVRLSYSFVKKALQEAGLVKKRRARGRHRLRREPRRCFGEMVHLDGSPHAWLALRPEQRQTLVAVVDDATKALLYAQLWESESSQAVMSALRAVMETHGLPMSLYTDRAGWAVHTPKSGEPDREKLTQVGRALKQLGIEHILAYSPQARGRSERANRTLQDRLVNELRLAKIRTVGTANRYLRTRFVAAYNRSFARPPAEPDSAFVPPGAVDLDAILCHQEQRTVALDNTVVLDGIRLQIPQQPGRRTCARRQVTVQRHLDGRHSVWLGSRQLGQYDSRGRPLEQHQAGRKVA